MSAKKSFDVRRRAPSKSASSSTVKVQRSEVRRKYGRPAASSPGKRESLKARRQKANMLLVWLVIFVLSIALGALIYGFWRPEVRIVSIETIAEYRESFSQILEEELSGAYGFVVPKDSIFFYPQEALRAAILDAHPEIAAVSFKRASFTSLAADPVLRTVAFWWCGTPGVGSAKDETCYEADASGFIYAPVRVTAEMASTTESERIPTGSTLRLFAALDTASSTVSYPLGSRMKNLTEIPGILTFMKELKKLGIVPVSAAIRGDEIDLFVSSGTRLTYVIGKELEAFALAEAALPELALHDGSILYVDLRFPGKVYLKRREE